MNILSARNLLASALILVLFNLSVLALADSLDDSNHRAQIRHAAIASAHPLATDAGTEIFEAGGNAFDAAVAIAAALGVVEPAGSGFGGGGFFLLHRDSDKKQTMIDAREKAPAAADADMYLDDAGEFDRGSALNGPLAGGIPGLAAGLVALSENYGRLPLSVTLAPAIRLARNGFSVTDRYKRLMGFRAAAMAVYPETAEIFMPGGPDKLELGLKIIQPDLATTIESLASNGIDGFYAGEVAKKLVAGVQSAGGIWTLEDLAAYRVVERAPIVFQYQDLRIVSAPPPSSGGIVLAETLNVLENYDLKILDELTRRHVVIEAMRRGYRDRAEYLGDPDFVDIPIAKLTSKAYSQQLAKTLSLEQATPSDTLPTIGADSEGRNTTHFSVVDAEGNRVAGTLSVNYPFGAVYAPPGTGVLVNNEMDDFSSRPLTPNAYGLVGYKANAIAPGKRPLSSMTPTFIESKDRIGVLGTPGGSRIISMVLLGILSFHDGEDPEQWVAVKRFHHQYLPDEVQFEKNGLSVAQQTDLKRRGHTLKEISRNYGNMHAISIDRASGLMKAASDPRGEGKATVISLP
ncbi:MAG: gamma-glutamyltransferase [Gammaproteobacteria bacterium]